MSTIRDRLLAGTVTICVSLLVASVGAAEEDHLEGYKIKDLNQVPAPDPIALANLFGSSGCKLKKAQFFLVQSEQAGGNDPRGGSPGHFVCYKATCTGPRPPATTADSQFALHVLETKRASLVCLPVDMDVCGDGELDPSETCDGSDDAACPGRCLPACTCAPPQCPAHGGDPTACNAVFSINECSECCYADDACGSACAAATIPSLCSDAPANDACAAAVNAQCGGVCCP